MTRSNSPIKIFFPIRGKKWLEYASDPYISRENPMKPGYGSWRYRRSSTHLHRGIDLHTAPGTPLIAVVDGVIRAKKAISENGEISYAGNRLILHHETGAVFKYFHLGSSNTDPSDAFAGNFLDKECIVKAGELIGFIGFSGGDKAQKRFLTRTQAHLHFEYYPYGEAAGDHDPVDILKYSTPCE